MKLIKKLRDKHCKGCKYEFKGTNLNCCNKPLWEISNILQPKKLFCFKKVKKS